MFTGEMFEPVVEHFATRHRVIVPDLRGHGRSRALASPYTAAQLAPDLSRLLDHLRIDSTAVLGYSHGGAIAQQLVLDHPTRCNRLVLPCTYAFNMATFRERLEGHLLPLLLDVAGMRQCGCHPRPLRLRSASAALPRPSRVALPGKRSAPPARASAL